MLLIKIGGGKDINLKGIISDLAALQEAFFIVHGANALRDQLAEALGLPRKTLTSVSGYSSVYSDEAALDLLLMAYAGLKNKRIVELCQQHGINAVGLSGVDGRVIQGRRNRGIRVRQNGRLRIVRDFSGKPQSVNRELLQWLLDHDYTPVLTVPIIDEHQTAVNSENDDIVVQLHKAFQPRMIIQLIEAPGLLADHQDPRSWVEHLSPTQLEGWEARVTGRMKRKLLALRRLFEQGARTVIISDGRGPHPIKDALKGKGTVIR